MATHPKGIWWFSNFAEVPEQSEIDYYNSFLSQIFSAFFIFLGGQENETKEAARVTGQPLALLVIGAACGTRCAQTATDPTDADGCDARARDEGSPSAAAKQK